MTVRSGACLTRTLLSTHLGVTGACASVPLHATVVLMPRAHPIPHAPLNYAPEHNRDMPIDAAGTSES